jgi:hypothetical protein
MGQPEGAAAHAAGVLVARTKQTMMGCCFGDVGSDADRDALFDEISAAPSPLPGMSGSCCSSAMGDLISTEGDCVQGEAAVAQLLALHKKLGEPSKYSAAVSAVKASYDAAEGSWSRHVPFSPVCGEIKGIGVQADALSKQMAADAGQVAPTSITDQNPKGTIDTLVTGVLWVGGLIAGALVLREAGKLKGQI